MSVKKTGLGFDGTPAKVEAGFRVFEGKHHPTITLTLPPCHPDDSAAWLNREATATWLTTQIAAYTQPAKDEDIPTPSTGTQQHSAWDDFDNLCRELMRWLAHNQHPHTHIVITANSAELSEGVRAINTNEYLVD